MYGQGLMQGNGAKFCNYGSKGRKDKSDLEFCKQLLLQVVYKVGFLLLFSGGFFLFCFYRKVTGT